MTAESSQILPTADVQKHPAGGHPTDDEIEKLIIAEAGNGLSTGWPRRKTFDTLRAAMSAGVDLRADYLPALRDFGEGARKGARGRVDVPANPEIMAAACQRRDRRLRTPPDRAVPPLVIVEVERPENAGPWRAFLAEKGMKSYPTDNRNGRTIAKVDPVLWERARQQAAVSPGSRAAAP